MASTACRHSGRVCSKHRPILCDVLAPPPSILQEFKIQNIVGSCDVKFPIRLEGLAYSHGYFATVRSTRHRDATHTGILTDM